MAGGSSPPIPTNSDMVEPVSYAALIRQRHWFKSSYRYYMVVVAQLVRASDCGSEGRRFDPDRSPKNGTMTERLGGGLQNLLDWFDSS